MVQVSASHSSSHTSYSGSIHNASSSTYHVHKGDTLSGIAARHGVSLDALTKANPAIASHQFIFPGDRLTIPATNSGTHIVHRGETLTSIARQSGTTAQALARANHIANPDRISVGQHLAIPTRNHPAAHPVAPHQPRLAPNAPAITAPTVGPVTGARLPGGTLALSATDVLNLKKTLQTEWVQSAGTRQAQGIIDTILNRRASGHWGNSISSVVNARQQFSDVNGPVARNRHGRSSVEEIPASMVSRRVNDLVNSYLAERAAGAPSSVGTHLNYANPHFSDRVNLGWIMKLDGPIYGAGNAIHRHGTTDDLQRYRPQPFNISLQ
jgi:LysM repeat protein